MNYYELQLKIEPNSEINRDLISAFLAEIGFESFVESEKGLDAYISEKNYSEERLAQTLKDWPLPDTHIRYRVEYIKDQNWNEEWEKNFFEPIIIDNRVIIHSSFHENIPTLSYDIVIDPKMAFGTGHHSTTSLMVSYLLELKTERKSFLDMGCGTAVLAILARMKGAGPVTAIDIDEWAYENSLENIKRNNTPEINVKLGDASLLGKEKYDFIFANINRNILLEDIPVYASCLLSGASLLMSGFYKEDMEAIKNKCEENQLNCISFKEDKNWAAVHFVKM
ncbi:MAG: 50S ribosomal protein L11 methyltransferase [Dysgonamonadaceae bacterium]|jgi:ribosomal protein L11 methyltransferase|nr:50S ribosomal protein L11 methyltransferase [Dysgonamonadaceae bacterium]